MCLIITPIALLKGHIYPHPQEPSAQPPVDSLEELLGLAKGAYISLTEIAPNGHSFTHCPQPSQRFNSTIAGSPFSNLWIAFIGQACRAKHCLHCELRHKLKSIIALSMRPFPFDFAQGQGDTKNTFDQDLF